MFNFDEKQGRIVIEVTGYLSMDLDNQQLEKIFNEMELTISHPLIVDSEFGIKEIDNKREKNYYQVCCDVINIVEDGYCDSEKKEAYNFAIKECDMMDKEDEVKEVMDTMPKAEYEQIMKCPECGFILLPEEDEMPDRDEFISRYDEEKDIDYIECPCGCKFVE